LRQIDRFLGCLLGLAAGDAVGTAVEFKPRGSFPPVTGMTGGGPFKLQAGQWTDDTSMALCLAASLVERRGFNAYDQMDRYVRWWDQGYMSSTGKCFDIGVGTFQALARYKHTGDPFAGSTDPNAAGNGSLMRLAPVAMFFYPDAAAARHHAAESSRTTHAAAECVDACRLFAGMLCRAFDGADKGSVLHGDAGFQGAPAIEAVARGEYLTKTAAGIHGAGYVVKSLEAALWSFATTETFEEAILAAVNLGDDADTTGAVCGQIAGAVYGVGAIPPDWLARLTEREMIEQLARELYDRKGAGTGRRGRRLTMGSGPNE
jgi:ADP-ribosyl-[dinitrogen reductase] hydrolase